MQTQGGGYEICFGKQAKPTKQTNIYIKVADFASLFPVAAQLMTQCQFLVLNAPIRLLILWLHPVTHQAKWERKDRPVAKQVCVLRIWLGFSRVCLSVLISLKWFSGIQLEFTDHCQGHNHYGHTTRLITSWMLWQRELHLSYWTTLSLANGIIISRNVKIALRDRYNVNTKV